MGRMFLACLMVPLAAWAQVEEPLKLELREGLVPEALAGGSVALSGEIYNRSSETVVISGAESPLAGQTLLQTYGTENGLRTVQILPNLTIAPQGMVELIPGTRELKLVGVTQDLRAGNELPLFIKDGRGRVQTLRVKVIQGYAN